MRASILHQSVAAPTSGPVIVGHRGSPRRARENTPASFAAAAAEGAVWVELDARRSRDGIVLVHHDPTLSDGRPLVEMTAAEASAAGVHHLGEILAGLPSGLGVDLEIKNLPLEPDFDDRNRIVGMCLEVVGASGERPLFMSSFNPMVLLSWTAADGPAPTGMLTHGVDLAGAMSIADDVGAAVLCPHQDTEGLDAEGIAAAHAAGLDVMAWTVDDPARASTLAAAGIDGLCTNVPAALREALSPG